MSARLPNNAAECAKVNQKQTADVDHDLKSQVEKWLVEAEKKKQSKQKRGKR